MLPISKVSASTCSFGISTMEFGQVDTLGGGAVDTTATLSITCSSMALGSVRVCPNINAGSGGSSGGVRQLKSASNKALSFQLYRDPARTILWGSAQNTLLGLPPTIDLFATPIVGTASRSVTIYGRIFGGQAPQPPGNYLSTFSGAETMFIYGDVSLLNCAVTLLGGIARPAFVAQARVDANCMVDAADMDFGVHGLLDHPVNAVGEVSVICTPGTNYTIGLGAGSSGTVSDRRMRSGAGEVHYNLYHDIAHTQLWEDSGGNTVAGAGDGSVQDHPVYGLVPSQSAPPPGVYNDTIVVTVTY